MRKILISGIGPSSSGVGRLMRTLLVRCPPGQYRIWSKYEKRSLKLLLRHLKIGNLFWEVARTLIGHGLFYTRLFCFMRTGRLTNADPVVIHPQALGWKTFFRICSKTRVRLYVMDNSFFCIQTYNHKRGEFQECFDCLGAPEKCHATCKPFPVNYPKARNLAYLAQLKTVASNITFLAQNRNQADLIKQHFGNVSCRLVGLSTYEFSQDSIGVGRDPANRPRVDMVYHGALHEAKGMRFVLKLAAYLEDYRLFIPESKKKVQSNFRDMALSPNILFQNTTWETGLKEYVEQCRLVLCPSMWSAPVEGALVKSLLHNGNVAVFNTRYGYQAELPQNIVLRLDHDFEESADKIRNHLRTDTIANGDRVRAWVRQNMPVLEVSALFS